MILSPFIPPPLPPPSSSSSPPPPPPFTCPTICLTIHRQPSFSASSFTSLDASSIHLLTTPSITPPPSPCSCAPWLLSPSLYLFTRFPPHHALPSLHTHDLHTLHLTSRHSFTSLVSLVCTSGCMCLWVFLSVFVCVYLYLSVCRSLTVIYTSRAPPYLCIHVTYLYPQTCCH